MTSKVQYVHQYVQYHTFSIYVAALSATFSVRTISSLTFFDGYCLALMCVCGDAQAKSGAPDSPVQAKSPPVCQTDVEPPSSSSSDIWDAGRTMRELKELTIVYGVHNILDET